MDGILIHTSNNDAPTNGMLLNRIKMTTSEPSSSESVSDSSSYLSVTIALQRNGRKKSAHILSALLANLYPQQKLLSIYLSAVILTANLLYQCSMTVRVMLQNYGHLFAGGQLILLSGQQQFITVNNATFPLFSHLLH